VVVRSRELLAMVAAILVVMASGAVHAADGAPVDLNTATAEQLEALPGIGPSKAQAIVAHRELAPFKSTDELVEVKGIGEKLYAQLKDRVTVSAGAPGASRPAAGGEQAAAAAPDAKTARSATTAGAR